MPAVTLADYDDNWPAQFECIAHELAAALAARYAALKRELAATHAHDKAGYTEARAPFIRQVLACALVAGQLNCTGRA